MTKLKQFSNGFYFLHSEEQIHRLGEYSGSQAMERVPQGILGRRKFYRTLEMATWKYDVIG